MNKIYLLSFLLLSGTALAGNSDTDMNTTYNTPTITNGVVEDWSTIDGDSKWAGDYQKKMSSRYGDTQWDGLASNKAGSNERSKAREIIPTVNTATKAAAAASKANQDLNNSIEDLKAKEEAAETAKANLEAAEAARTKACTDLGMSEMVCGALMDIGYIPPTALLEDINYQQAADKYNNAQTALSEANSTMTSAAADVQAKADALEAANAAAQKEYEKIDSSIVNEMMSEYGNPNTDNWDEKMANSTQREALQTQLDNMWKDYANDGVQKYDLNTAAGQEGARNFLDALNKKTQTTTTGAEFWRLYQVRHSSDGIQDPIGSDT